MNIDETRFDIIFGVTKPFNDESVSRMMDEYILRIISQPPPTRWERFKAWIEEGKYPLILVISLLFMLTLLTFSGVRLNANAVLIGFILAMLSL